MSAYRRVLFIERDLRNEKLGIMYLSAALKSQGHHTALVQSDKQDLDERIRDYRPDFVAFSITTGEQVQALKTARQVKERYGIPNIFGGPHCTFFPEIGYEPEVDFVVQGQGERAIVDIVERRIKRGFLKAGVSDGLDELAFPDRGIFYEYPEFRDNPMKNVITSRACPYRCAYCFNPSQLALAKMDGETRLWFDRRSVSNVAAEINEIGDRYPLEKVLFVDDSFIQGNAWLHGFLDGYRQRVGLPWLCSLRVNRINEGLAEKMVAAGLEMVNYAMESADPDVQQRLLNRGHIRNGEVIRAISLFDRHGVRARMQNMIGLPLSNPLEDALNTLQFNMRHRVTDSWCSIFQPYPRTALGQYCVDHGFASPDQLEHCAGSFFDESRLDIPNKDELYALQKLWYFIVEGNLPIDLVQILIRGRFTPSVGDQLQRLRFRCSRQKLYGLDQCDHEAAVNVQSRERWAPPQYSGESRAGETAGLVRAALNRTGLPDQVVEILSQVPYEPREVEGLRRYLDGEQVYPAPIYTIDDRTGDLKEPGVSIYIRGTDHPEENDIRLMPEERFMGGMAEVRRTLSAGEGDDQECKSDPEPVAAGLTCKTGAAGSP